MYGAIVMILLVGLGNPGDKYIRTRHNIGFMAVDEIADTHSFGPEKSKHQGLVREGTIGSEKVAILKPQTYMNESGRAVGAMAKFYKIDPSDIIVFHDELDLAPGKLRTKTGGGHAGHNGLRSIHAHIGESYRRVRLGIGHPGDKSKVSGYVLHDFAKTDAEWIGPQLATIAKEATWLVKGDDQRFQTAVAQGLTPPKKGAKPSNKEEKPTASEGKPLKTDGKSGKLAEKPSDSDDGPFAALKRMIKGT